MNRVHTMIGGALVLTLSSCKVIGIGPGSASLGSGGAGQDTTGPGAEASSVWPDLDFSTVASIPMPKSGFASVVVSNDFNGDGKADLAMVAGYVGDDTAGVYVALSNGDGTFSKPTFNEFRAGNSLAAGHFRTNAILDLVNVHLNGNDEGAAIFAGKGNGAFRTATKFRPAGPAGVELVRLVAADINHDGVSDILYNVEARIAIMLGSKNGVFGRSSMLDDTQTAGTFAVGDLDGDDFPEIVTVKAAGAGQPDRICVFANRAGRIDDNAKTYSLGTKDEEMAAIAVGDLNGDGKGDVAVTVNGNSSKYAKVFINLGNGTFDEPVKYALDGSKLQETLFLVDVNGDRKLDLVTYAVWPQNQDPGTFLVLPGKGDGRFGKQPVKQVFGVPYTNPTYPNFFATGDFLGNGLQGFAIIHNKGNVASIEVMSASRRK
jgi:hypothetical protein